MFLSAPQSQTIVVSYSFSFPAGEGSASPDDVGGPLTGTITFLPGETVKDIVLPTLDDGVFEGGPGSLEAINLTLTVIQGADPQSVTVTGFIEDASAPSVAISDTEVEEGGLASFTVTLSQAVNYDVVVNYSTADGTAIDGEDYAGEIGTVTIPAGQISAVVTIQTTPDEIFEDDETFTVSLTPNQGAIDPGASDLTATGTITNDDAKPTVSIGDVTVSEGGTATFTVTLSNPAEYDIVLNYATADGTAVDGSDYTGTSGSVTIPAGETTATATIDVLTTDDGTFEDTESFTVNLTPVNAGDIDGANSDLSGTGTIADNEAAPTASISDGTPGSIVEGEGSTISFTVTLSGPTDQAVTVDYMTVDGTALAGSDFTATSGTLTFAPGETTKTIVVTILNDATIEDPETFTVQISNAQRAGDALTITDNSGSATIIDDEPVTTDDSAETDEDSSVDGTVVDNTTDVDNDPASLVYSVVGAAPTGLTFNADGTWTFNPTGNFDGLDTGESATVSFQYKANDGQADSNTSTVTITINGVNDPPKTTNDTATTNEDTSVNGTVVDNTTDPDDNPAAFNYSIVGPTPTGLTFNADGTWAFDPAGNFDGLDTGESATVSFQYKANDGQADSNTSTVTITINGVNDPPVTTDDSATTNEDTSVNGTVVDNTTDPDDNPAAFNYSIVGPTPTGLTFNADGTWTFDPAGNFDGLDTGESATVSFQYKANDGEADSNTSTVTITIHGGNNSPTTTDDTATTSEDTLVGGSVVDNTTDPDDAPASLAYSVVGTVPAGLVFNADGTWSFDPAGNFDGLDTGESTTVSFQYKANDGQADSNTSTVTITINGVNDPPNDDERQRDDERGYLGQRHRRR